MTQKASTARLVLYVFIAMATTASSGIMSIDFTNSRQLAAWGLAIFIAGLTTARSYIDKSESQIDQP
jgi:hypothetical protein